MIHGTCVDGVQAKRWPVQGRLGNGTPSETPRHADLPILSRCMVVLTHIGHPMLV